MSEPLHIYFNKLKLAFYTLLSLGLVALSTLMLLVGNHLIHKIAGVIGILFFGFGCILFISKILNFKAGLIINAEGIYDNSTVPPTGFIAWKDIKSIGFSGQVLVVELTNPNELIAQQKTINRFMFKLNNKRYGTPAVISVSMLRLGKHELTDAIKRYLWTSQKF